MHPIQVTRDPRLHARITRRAPLTYREGADQRLDRPGHVRAASGLAWLGDRLAIIQDDASFIALIDAPRSATAPDASKDVPADPHAGATGPAGPDPGGVDVLTLPASAGGLRQFDDIRGNKADKLDLEACFSFTDGGETHLVAFGSGSTPARERIAMVAFAAPRQPGVPQAPRVDLIPAPELYRSLRDAVDFAGAELNVEGAALLSPAVLRLFGRGNGAARDGRQPVNATCDIDWPGLRAHLLDSTRPAPAPRAIRRYHLGELDGIPLGFTDAIPWGGGVMFSAAAEASPDAVRDGRVAGSMIGIITGDVRGRCTVVTDIDGRPFTGKIEGLAEGPDPGTVYAVADEDDPAKPSELCVIALSGPWADGAA